MPLAFFGVDASAGANPETLSSPTQPHSPPSPSHLSLLADALTSLCPTVEDPSHPEAIDPTALLPVSDVPDGLSEVAPANSATHAPSGQSTSGEAAVAVSDSSNAGSEEVAGAQGGTHAATASASHSGLLPKRHSINAMVGVVANPKDSPPPPVHIPPHRHSVEVSAMSSNSSGSSAASGSSGSQPTPHQQHHHSHQRGSASRSGSASALDVSGGAVNPRHLLQLHQHYQQQHKLLQKQQQQQQHQQQLASAGVVSVGGTTSSSQPDSQVSPDGAESAFNEPSSSSSNEGRVVSSSGSSGAAVSSTTVSAATSVSTVTSTSTPLGAVPHASQAQANIQQIDFGPLLQLPIYVALYNYKPQKDDELELRKGDHYTVCEKCQDGWFKGRSLRSGQTGVFPGNYVQLVKTPAFQPRMLNSKIANVQRIVANAVAAASGASTSVSAAAVPTPASRPPSSVAASTPVAPGATPSETTTTHNSNSSQSQSTTKSAGQLQQQLLQQQLQMQRHLPLAPADTNVSPARVRPSPITVLMPTPHQPQQHLQQQPPQQQPRQGGNPSGADVTAPSSVASRLVLQQQRNPAHVMGSAHPGPPGIAVSASPGPQPPPRPSHGLVHSGAITSTCAAPRPTASPPPVPGMPNMDVVKLLHQHHLISSTTSCITPPNVVIVTASSGLAGTPTGGLLATPGIIGPHGQIHPHHAAAVLAAQSKHVKDKGDKRMNMLRRLAGGGRKKSKSPPTVGADVEPVRPQAPQQNPPQAHAVVPPSGIHSRSSSLPSSDRSPMPPQSGAPNSNIAPNKPGQVAVHHSSQHGNVGISSRCANSSNGRPTLQSQSSNLTTGVAGTQIGPQVSPVISNQVHVGPHVTRQQSAQQQHQSQPQQQSQQTQNLGQSQQQQHQQQQQQLQSQQQFQHSLAHQNSVQSSQLVRPVPKPVNQSVMVANSHQIQQLAPIPHQHSHQLSASSHAQQQSQPYSQAQPPAPPQLSSHQVQSHPPHHAQQQQQQQPPMQQTLPQSSLQQHPQAGLQQQPQPHPPQLPSGAIAGSSPIIVDANGIIEDPEQRNKIPPMPRERFRCIVPYPPNSEYELALKVGDVVFVHKKREDGWYKGTQQRTGKCGLFPGSFVEPF